MSGTVRMKARPQPNGVPFIIRVLWFFIFGLELTAVWILVAWLLNATIIGLPLGLWMIDRVPQVLTLKSQSQQVLVNKATGQSFYRSLPQVALPVRILYFVFVGWWASLIWAGIAWLLCGTIIGLPIGVIMLHGLPFVTTLRRV